MVFVKQSNFIQNDIVLLTSQDAHNGKIGNIYEYKLNDRKSVCLSARCKIDTHTELKSSKRQAAAKTTKYSSTRITTLVFVHYYASTYSFSISTHAVFLHSSFTIQLYFTHFSVLYFSLSLSLSLSLSTLSLFTDRNHITKFTNITHTLKNEPCLYAHSCI